MASAEQPCYTLLYSSNDDEQANELQLKQDLEKGSTKEKQDALKKVIQLILAGEKMPSLLMTVIRFVMPSQDHMLKKLLLIFWEIVPKYSSDGKLMQEMILVCDAYRKDLQHPNEFIRGSTLRFLCKLKESELLEPLMPAIRSCLEHRHSYVRRNAVLAIFTIFRNFDFLIPDAPELIANFLEQEQDASCKRNAFMMLIHADQDRALNYLCSCIDQVNSFGDILQLVIVELIYKVCHANPSERGRFIRCIYNLLNSNSAAVRYEAAGTLVTLSNAPTAVKAAASTYIELILKESDNNVKLIVLDRLVQLKELHEKVLQELIMDIVRVLITPDLDVRKKTLDLVLDLISSRNIEELVQVLRKEIVKTNNSTEQEDMGKYRQLLVRTLHHCTIKFPDQAASVIPVLIEFLSDQNESAAVDVLVFIREAMQKFEQHRNLMIEKLLETFSSIRSVKIYRAAIWILGEYCKSVEDLQGVMTLIRQSLGELPIVEDEQHQLLAEAGGETSEQLPTPNATVQRLVTADGTYATQSALVSTSSNNTKKERPVLRSFFSDGEFFVAAALSTTLTKMALRYVTLVPESEKQNRFVGECLYIIACIMHYGKSGMPTKPINEDDYDRLCLSMRALCEQVPVLKNAYIDDCRNALKEMLAAVAKEEKEEATKKSGTSVKIHADSPVTFSQLLDSNELGVGEDLFELTLSQALGVKGEKSDTISSSKLNKVTQLTGFSDPVYAEAYVNVNQYDIVLDVLIVNQTADTLQNVVLELATLGDLKLVEKPSPVTLAPNDFSNIKASVKVASTENGIIFGNIVYDVSSATSSGNCVVLSDLHIDIMDYLVPASCTDTDFRVMWAEFEWENKVAVTTQLTDLRDYLEQLLKATNMRCLTPPAALDGHCGFMAANLYAKSIFGEHALANVSIELPPSGNKAGVVQGHIRIRAKSQGMALSLGDKVNSSQKKFKPISSVGEH